MNDTGSNLVRVELHVHTRVSKDSLIRLDDLLKHCQKTGVDRVAITDHNRIEGALEGSKIAPEQVIVGEEIETTHGELIGYFMTEWVPPGFEPMEAIQRLRQQGAVISVPHPFDTIRSQHWSTQALMSILPHIDAIETFNARCMTASPNLHAAAFAREHGCLETVGSDAHSLYEVGRAILMMDDFTDAESFKKALINAHQKNKRSPAFVHLFSRYAVLYKKLAGIKT